MNFIPFISIEIWKKKSSEKSKRTFRETNIDDNFRIPGLNYRALLIFSNLCCKIGISDENPKMQKKKDL